MLTALARGLRGNQWFSLIDKVYADKTLELAWAKVESNAGGGGVDVTGGANSDCFWRLKSHLR